MQDIKDGDLLLKPVDRPACHNCGKRLAPKHRFKEVREETLFGFSTTVKKTGRVRGYGYNWDNLFCTLRCGYFYACRSIKEKT